MERTAERTALEKTSRSSFTPNRKWQKSRKNLHSQTFRHLLPFSELKYLLCYFFPQFCSQSKSFVHCFASFGPFLRAFGLSCAIN